MAIPESPTGIEVGHYEFYAPPVSSRYEHSSFTLESDPQSVQVAWRAHALGYKNAGFVSDEAITPEGYLVEDIDSSRDMQSTYYLVSNLDDNEDVATARKVHIPNDGSYRDLPAYKLCGDHISDQNLRILEAAENDGVKIKEISALAGTKSHVAVHEVIRRIVTEGALNNELWFCGLVSSTYDALVKKWGKNTLVTLGEPVHIDDDRVNPGVSLVPLVMKPGDLFDNILDAYEKAEHPEDKSRLRKTFLFYTEEIPRTLETSRISEARKDLLV